MKKALAGLFFSLVLSTTAAQAFNTSFLDYSGMSNFTSADWKISEDSAVAALDRGKDNVKAYWHNPHSQASGYVIPFNTTHRQGVTCRDLVIFNQARDVTDKATYHFCKLQGEWRITD